MKSPATGLKSQAFTRAVALVSSAALLLAACGTASPIAPSVRPVVERLDKAVVPPRWSFRYIPNSASPFLACLAGIDEVSGVMDIENGVVFLEPNRDAPPIVVTDTSFMIAANNSGSRQWTEVPWNAENDRRSLAPLFGDVLTGFIADGIRAPDLNLTALAAVSIAESVEPADTPIGLVGDSFTVTMDSERYRAELEAEGAPVPDQTPSLTATVNPDGLVIALAIGTAASSPADDEPHGSGYFVTAAFDEVNPVLVPDAAIRRTTSLSAVLYPGPDESCSFRP